MTAPNSTPQSVSSQPPPGLEEAVHYLRQVNCLTPQDEAVNRALLRQSLLLAAEASDYQILGICADTLAEAIQALESYAAALRYAPEPNLPTIEEAVYIKFNPNTGLCYASPYSGTHRGVLVSCQSVDETGVNEMFGHLPLDLFLK